ncbi:hypothetical protein C8R32_1011, partial [Nitrosospira sp. Nsp5]
MQIEVVKVKGMNRIGCVNGSKSTMNLLRPLISQGISAAKPRTFPARNPGSLLKW